MPPILKKRPSPASLIRHILAIVLFLVAAGCSGGGCSSGCSSCGGITPLTNGFDVTKRIENAGSARVTPHGLQFLQSNLGALAKGLLGSAGTNGVITFDIPMQTGLPLGITLCPSGSNASSDPKVCVAEIDIANANLTITPTSPNDLVITGTLPLRIEDLELGGVLGCTLGVSITGNGACDKPDAQTTFDAFPVDIDIQIHVDSTTAHTARYGYTRIDIPQIINTTTANSNLSSSLNICGSGLLCGILGDILNAISGALTSTITSQLTGTLASTIDSQLCQKATATVPCPTGTTADSSMICRFNNDPNNACASILLGTDGNINLGGLLASLSPGTTGGLDFVFAGGGSDTNPATMLPWGNLDPIKGGATLGLFGGAEANPLSKCVPVSSMALPTGIPIPDELLAATTPPDTVPNWPASLPGPDVEIALNERFANYALNSMYNSGFLCIGISTESIPLLSSGTLGLLAPSSKKLGLQENPQQVAIVIRPSTPPTVVFGNGTNLTTDPLLNVSLKQVSLDFYMFSLDRFIRFMTATFDLTVPVNLTVDSSGLTPVIQTIGVNNGVVTNSQLLAEMPSDLANSLGSLIGTLVGQEVAGSLKAINLNSSLASLGLALTIPDTVMGMGSPGLIKLTKSTDNYLGIFASLGLAPMGPTPPGMLRTNIQLLRKTVDPAGLKFETLRPGNQPVVELVAESELDDGTRAVEYQYKVDKGFWHPFQASRFITVDDAWLRVQGVHVIHVRSRAVGVPGSLDVGDAQIEVAIDAEPPTIKIAEGEGGQVRIEAHDMLTADPMVRYRLDDKDWSNWTLASHLTPIAASDATQVSVQAQDSEGNLGTASSALVRGRFDGTAAACGSCNVGSRGAPTGSVLFLLGITLAGIGTRLFGRRSTPLATRRLSLRGGAAKRAMAAVGLVAAAGSWTGCSCGKADVKQGGTTTASGCPSCITLSPGLIGEYASVAVSGSDVWVSGYSEADWDNGNSYGDLVVGKVSATTGKVSWVQVDGVPSTPAVDCTVYDCTGFRGGQTEPGDDVGLWTSIAIGSDGNPAVAYLDNTHQALKFAQFDGRGWSVQTVDTVMGGIAGRYAKMIFLNGNFVIAYQTIAPGGTSGALISKVRVATSSGLTPAAATWAFEDAATVNTTPCRASFCTTTQACLSTTKQCTTTLDMSMCTPSCASGSACVTSATGPACVVAWDDTKIDAYPDAIGDYITLAPDGQGGFGIAYYDRTNGDLRIAVKSMGAWSTMLVDGESAPANSGDSGIGATLFIDTAGVWHLAYVNGYTEALQYVEVTAGGTKVGKPEIVDNGLMVAGTSNTDGQHLVGDDAHIVVLDSGEVHITYEDSTAGTLHYAVGTPGSTGHMWNVAAVTQDGFAGAFSSIVVANNQSQLMNWWRTGGTMGTAGDIRLVAPPL